MQQYKHEKERNQWTEAESRWISLTEELRAEVEANRSLAEEMKRELDAERKCSKELKDALQIAIDDVKKATSEAGVRNVVSKLIHTPAAETSALKAAKEEERRILIDENRGLQYQLKDTSEAMQAAGELLVPLKEVEGVVTAKVSK
ncbi:kinesin-like protein KIN12B-like [Trifolium medium]|uniref:Kinesin-like protein KIN12B-like n=1 Tax=Trifolium medium TaxID=97028 RepID=A0A392NKH9_9FABA|nr:kinesin-like protein KIN12B-like [Trifolium medium]